MTATLPIGGSLSSNVASPLSVVWPPAIAGLGVTVICIITLNAEAVVVGTRVDPGAAEVVGVGAAVVPRGAEDVFGALVVMGTKEVEGTGKLDVIGAAVVVGGAPVVVDGAEVVTGAAVVSCSGHQCHDTLTQSPSLSLFPCKAAAERCCQRQAELCIESNFLEEGSHTCNCLITHLHQ